MEPGGLSVITHSGLLMPTYFAELWDLIEICVLHTFIDLALEVVTIIVPLSLYVFYS